MDEYLAFEAASDVKHEYVQGLVYAMTGTTRAHNKIALNAAFVLKSELRDGPYHPYIQDVKLRVDAASAFYYPDIIVACDPAGDDQDVYVSDATLVVEVLSKSTEAYDRGDKLKAYITLPSLLEYLLIDSRRRSIEIYRRDGDKWTWQAVAEQDPVELESLDIRTTYDALYDRVSFDEPEETPADS